MEAPPLVGRALALAEVLGFEKSCQPADGALLHVLAVRRGTARAADAVITETRGGHLVRLVDVAQVDHQRARQEVPDAAEIEPAKLVPFGQQD